MIFYFQVSDIYSFPQKFSPLFCSFDLECRGQQTVSAKGHIVNILSFASHGVPALNTASVAPKQPHTYVNKCTYLCSMIIVGAGLDWAFGPFLLFISYLSPTPYSLSQVTEHLVFPQLLTVYSVSISRTVYFLPVAQLVATEIPQYFVEHVLVR